MGVVAALSAYTKRSSIGIYLLSTGKKPRNSLISFNIHLYGAYYNPLRKNFAKNV
jgi:hypothetical protein